MKNPDFLNINPEFSTKEQPEPKLNFSWKTNEQIEVKPLYTKEDIKHTEHLDYLSGLPPFLR